jgi:hypothetical protein
MDEPAMPDCDAQYLIEYLFEIGPTEGDAPLSHAELQAWQQNTGITLQPWELRLLKKLSLEYLGMYREASEPDCPVPWEDAPYANFGAHQAALAMKNAIKEMDSL